MLKCPIHELPHNVIVNNFYARISGQHKDYLDACSEGSFTRKEVEARWDLLDRIEENAEGWENNKGEESGYADKPHFKPLPPKEGNEEKEKKKKKGTKKKKKKKKKENKEKEAMAYPRVYEVTIGNRKYVAPNDYYDNKSEYDDLPMPCTHVSDHDLDEHTTFDIGNLFGTGYEMYVATATRQEPPPRPARSRRARRHGRALARAAAASLLTRDPPGHRARRLARSPPGAAAARRLARSRPARSRRRKPPHPRPARSLRARRLARSPPGAAAAGRLPSLARPASRTPRTPPRARREPPDLERRAVMCSSADFVVVDCVLCGGGGLLERDIFDLFLPEFDKPWMEGANTKIYQLGNGGDLVFERDLDAVSEILGRPHPEFHGVEIHDQPGGELQWVITADLRGKMEPPTSEMILFSIKESNWMDRLARALQEALARVCGHHVIELQGSHFAHFARHDTIGEPMALSSHPVLKYHVEHLDLMLHETQKELDNARVYANQTHMALAHHADAIKMLAKDRKSLRLQRAKKDATIARLRAKIVSLEATVKAQEDQLREMEDEGEDFQGGGAFLSDDEDFEEDEYTDVEDYEFLEAGEDDYIPIDIDDEE
ncbi:hypothetical protein QYE76_051944 [Lolium multiflorum]|uniref:Uncharacterized protein n=1 Tax=Lolium multiflorum TaxID=4521 RepID=A0AAD8STQ8_LOLMU|nr:hypothetical protein QYE76_051944 [Lolium multiflorum]